MSAAFALGLAVYVSAVMTIEEVRADNENLRRQVDELKRALAAENAQVQ